MDRAEPLHRHGDRDDDFAALVDAHHAALLALQRVGDLLITVAVLRPELAIEWKVAAIEPGTDRDRRAFGDARLLAPRRRTFQPQHVAASVKGAAVENYSAVAVENAGAGFGWRNQPPQ